MIISHTADSLRAFEQRVAEAFNRKEIPYPVHLSGNNEDALITLFKEVGPNDWVCGSWRTHYHCLLKGVPEDDLMAAIHRGRSMTLCFPEYRIISSAIVGGILPIATGIAMGIKRRGGTERVWCFAGDMTAHTGMFHECAKYAAGHRLPVQYVIEDNGLSVCASTDEVWGDAVQMSKWPVRAYSYHLPFPHSGAGKRITF